MDQPGDVIAEHRDRRPLENAHDALGNAFRRDLTQFPRRRCSTCALLFPHVTFPYVDPAVCHVSVELEVGIAILARCAC